MSEQEWSADILDKPIFLESQFRWGDLVTVDEAEECLSMYPDAKKRAPKWLSTSATEEINRTPELAAARGRFLKAVCLIGAAKVLSHAKATVDERLWAKVWINMMAAEFMRNRFLLTQHDGQAQA